MEKRQLAEAGPSGPTSASAPHSEDTPSKDDEDAADSGLVGTAVVEKVLGGKIIDELPADRP